MIYQGSKARLIKDILLYIQNCIDSNKVQIWSVNIFSRIKMAYITSGITRRAINYDKTDSRTKLF